MLRYMFVQNFIKLSAVLHEKQKRNLATTLQIILSSMLQTVKTQLNVCTVIRKNLCYYLNG